MMIHSERILAYLWSIAPSGATNGEIARRLGVTPHQTVFQATRDLMRRGQIAGRQVGREWVFSAADEVPESVNPSPGTQASERSEFDARLSPAGFEALARRVLGEKYGVDLRPGSVVHMRKLFDFVSPDGRITGDAKYYTRVAGTRLPPAKFSVIAEHVWLLEKTQAPSTFLVFGNDRLVPVLWLERYGNLVGGTDFYFLTDTGDLEQLHP